MGVALEVVGVALVVVGVTLTLGSTDELGVAVTLGPCMLLLAFTYAASADRLRA